MLEEQNDQKPCLHCMITELIGDFFAEYPATAGSDKVDTAEADEVIDAIAKTIAELTSQQDGLIRQQLIEHLIHQIMQYDAEFRREEAAEGAIEVSSKALETRRCLASRQGTPKIPGTPKRGLSSLKGLPVALVPRQQRPRGSVVLANSPRV